MSIKKLIAKLLHKLAIKLNPEIGIEPVWKKPDPDDIADQMKDEESSAKTYASHNDMGIQYVGELDIPRIIANAGIPKIMPEKGGMIHTEPDSPKKNIHTIEGWKTEERQIPKRFNGRPSSASTNS